MMGDGATGRMGGVMWSIRTGMALRVMLINLTAISTGFWIRRGMGEGEGEERTGLVESSS